MHEYNHEHHCGHNHGHCNHNGEEHCHEHTEGHHCHGKEGGCHGKGKWGGKREGAGRKCENPKIPFNRRLNEDLINKLKTYAEENGITETEALERAIKNL